MNSNLRKIFLETKWLKYPSLSKKNLENKEVYYGRLCYLDQKKITLKKQGKERTIEFKGEVYLGNLDGDNFFSQANPLEILKFDDIVCFINDFEQPKIILLAPSLVKGELLESENDFSFEISKEWSWFLNKIRAYFLQNNFTEVTTPSLVEAPGMEPFLKAFKTTIDWGDKNKTLYLPTSPEFSLKKMLSAGWTKIFEMKTCFRNEEISPLHQPEFMMLEWYRAYSNLEAIKDELLGLINCLLPNSATVEEFSFAEVFKELFDFELTPKTDSEDLKSLMREEKIDFLENESFDSMFSRVLIDRIDPWLCTKEFAILKDFPPSQAALARINSAGWGDRFELYFKGIELANAFHELNDPEEQLKRIYEANELKKSLGFEEFPVDADFVEALKSGMPPSGGIALGVDRLFMILKGLESIEQTRFSSITETTL